MPTVSIQNEIEARATSGRLACETLSPRRRRAVDRRTLAYKEWAKRRAALAAQLKRVPTPDENELLDLWTDLVVDADLRRARLQAGHEADRAELRAATHAIV